MVCQHGYKSTQRLYSELPPDVWAPHPISKAEPSHPTKEAHFGRLYPRSYSYGHYPKLMTIVEGWTGKSRALPSGSAPSTLQWSFTMPALTASSTRLSISRSILPSLVKKTPRYLNFLAWGSASLPLQSTVFWQRTMASDLEVLTLIPTASHSAANRPSACWRSRSDGANRTTSSAKSRDAILRSPSRTLSSYSPQ